MKHHRVPMVPPAAFCVFGWCFFGIVAAIHARKPIATAALQRPEDVNIHQLAAAVAVGNEDEFFAPEDFVVLPPPSRLRSVKFYPFTTSSVQRKKTQKAHKKPTKHAKRTSVGKLKSGPSGGKKCCGNEWSILTDKEGLHRLIQPHPSNQVYGHRNSDVKPVVEHIEDDLKYDFRTNTHWV